LLTSSGEHEQAEPHLQWLVDANPEDAGLRIDLARAFHEQGKSAEAAREIEVFRKLDLGDRRTQLWTRMRTYGLGEYVDQPSTATQ
jgi:thioredoxin-like negative regulator of GroEL